MKINQVLAFDIGGTKIAYAVVDRDGKIVNQVVRHPTPAAPGAVAKLLKTIISQFENQVDAIAVSTAGTVDKTTRKSPVRSAICRKVIWIRISKRCQISR